MIQTKPLCLQCPFLGRYHLCHLCPLRIPVLDGELDCFPSTHSYNPPNTIQVSRKNRKVLVTKPKTMGNVFHVV